MILACIAFAGCSLLGSQLRQVLFGCGPVKTSNEYEAPAPPGALPPPDALLIDDNGHVLAARAAELNVPLSYGLVLTSKQWEGISRVLFTYHNDQGTPGTSISSNVVERSRDSDSLTLQLASGRFLQIESQGACLLSKDGKVQHTVTEGMLSITLFHVSDLPDLKRRMHQFRQTSEQNNRAETTL